MSDHALRVWDVATGLESPYCAEHACSEFTGFGRDDQATIEDGVRLCFQRGATHYMGCGCVIKTVGPVEWNKDHPAYRFWGPTVLTGVETVINRDGDAFIA